MPRRLLAHGVLAIVMLAGCDAPLDANRMGDGHTLGDGGVAFGDGGHGPTCSEIEQPALPLHGMIDVIVLPDESAAMSAANDAFVAALEGPFADAMAAQHIDYHVVWAGMTPLPMLEASGRLTRLPYALTPTNMFSPLFLHYDGWRAALRPDSLKVFVQFTTAHPDDGSSVFVTGMPFDRSLSALDPGMFGTGPGHYKFVFDTFLGITANTPATDPYPSTAAVVSASCSTAYTSSTALQNLAIMTGGLRFPLCDTDHFGGAFRAIADASIAHSSMPCQVGMPRAPVNYTRNPSTVAVRFRASSGVSHILRQASSAGACDASSFTSDGTTITLCPDACAPVEADGAAVLTVLEGCDPSMY